MLTCKHKIWGENWLCLSPYFKAFPVFNVLETCRQGSKLKKMSGRKFATSYENLVATLKMLVAKLIEAI